MLTVTITPAAAVTAGAQWSLDGTTWYASGAKVSLPVTGSPYTVRFKDITGWTTPPTSLPVTIAQGQTTSGQGLYVQQTGSLKVTIGPAGALTAGAKWSVNGTTWNASGAIVSNTPAGSYTVTFKPVTGWNTAASVQNVIITDANTPATATGTYTQPVMTFTVPSSLGTVLQCSNSLDYLMNANVTPAGTYTYRMGTGSPPAGITVNSSGTVSGQPSSAASTYSFNVCVDDADGGELCKPTSIKVTALIPGAPSGPSPASRATGVSISPTLTWAPISTATSYDVYFGTTSTPPKVKSGITTTTYTPSAVLNTKTTYYWQVVANNSMCGTLSPTVTKGPVWSFTTGATAVTGTAAAGGPITGATVTLVDSAGNTASGTTGSAGSFSIHSDGLTPPFLLSVTTGETTYYSVSENLNAATTINITPLTDMIVRTWYAAQNPPVDVATAFGNPGTYPAPPPIAVSAIKPVVTGIVQPWLKLAGVNPVTFDPISTPFTATNGTGIAQVLEQTSETINSGNIAVAISNSATTQNTTMTSSATDGSVTCSTTYTTSGGTTKPLIAVSYVPITTAQQAALTGINTTVSQLVAAVNTRGAKLQASDIAPYVSSSFLNNGLTATQWETNVATSLAGASVSSGLLVNSLDTVNSVADISFTISTTKNGAISTSTLETTFTLVSGSWLISGNGQIASAYAQTWAWDNSSGYTKGLRFTVDDPQGVVTAVTVSGPGITGSITVPQVCGGSTGVSCGNAFGGYDTQSAFQIDVTNRPPTIRSTYAFTLTPSTAPPSYNSTVNAAFGFDASANPVSADYPSWTFINGGAPSLAEVMRGTTLHGSVYIPIWVTNTPQAPQFNYEAPSGQSNIVSNQLIQGTWDSGTAIPGQANNFTIVIPAAQINSVSDCNGGSGVCYNITFQGQTGDITGGWFGEDACYSGGRDEPTSCTNSGVEILQ